MILASHAWFQSYCSCFNPHHTWFLQLHNKTRQHTDILVNTHCCWLITQFCWLISTETTRTHVKHPCHGLGSGCSHGRWKGLRVTGVMVSGGNTTRLTKVWFWIAKECGSPKNIEFCRSNKTDCWENTWFYSFPMHKTSNWVAWPVADVRQKNPSGWSDRSKSQIKVLEFRKFRWNLFDGIRKSMPGAVINRLGLGHTVPEIVLAENGDAGDTVWRPRFASDIPTANCSIFTCAFPEISIAGKSNGWSNYSLTFTTWT